MLKGIAIPGLHYQPIFITKDQEKQLIQAISQQQWNTTLKRRTQHYGFTYSYVKKDTIEPAKPIPALFEVVKKQIQEYIKQKMNEEYVFDMVIVNEYEPGQGIASHIDNAKLFDHIIVSLSLGSDVVMNFQSFEGKKQEMMLARRSLLILSGDSRYKWKHGIQHRKKDMGIMRKTRYSLTFRRMTSSKIEQ